MAAHVLILGPGLARNRSSCVVPIVAHPEPDGEGMFGMIRVIGTDETARSGRIGTSGDHAWPGARHA
jgi:hypothetical protein